MCSKYKVFTAEVWRQSQYSHQLRRKTASLKPCSGWNAAMFICDYRKESCSFFFFPSWISGKHRRVKMLNIFPGVWSAHSPRRSQQSLRRADKTNINKRAKGKDDSSPGDLLMMSSEKACACVCACTLFINARTRLPNIWPHLGVWTFRAAHTGQNNNCQISH